MENGRDSGYGTEIKGGQKIIEYMFSHSYWGLCAWDLPALIVLVFMIAVFVLHRRKMEKRKEEFEEELAEMQNGQE